MILVQACGGETPLGPFTVYVAEDAPEAVRVAAEDVQAYLERMGREVTLEQTSGEAPGCRDGHGRVVFLGDSLGEASLDEGATDQTHRVQVEGCGESGRRVLLSGGGLLGRQYAAYEWLHSLGVRFFHPEDEFVPEALPALAVDVDRSVTPAFRFRSVSLHLTHPLELGDAFRLGDERYFDEGDRYVDWQIKNRASFGTDFRGRGYMRGLPRSAGIRIWGGQQSDDVVVDPDDPRSEEEQVKEAIDAIMLAPHEVPVTHFNVNFTPTEYTEMPPQQALDMLTFIAEYFAENYPDVRLHAGNQGTHGEPTELGPRYADLSSLAPTNLGVTVHSLMFYDLFRPAPVYGNENFNFLFDFMEQEYEKRTLWHFPEAAWWLTFDIAVPLYLPITLEARDRDIQGIKHMLAGKLDGHRVFGSGHEWGFWQNEYCSFRMAAELDYRFAHCLEDLTSPLGAGAAGTREVVEAAIALQERDMFDGELIAYLVGTDQETELAESLGIVHHPLPPAPALVLGLGEEDLARYEDAIEPRLQTIETDYAALVASLRALEPEIDPHGKRFFDEILDGLEMFEIRAAHQWRAYGALARHRRSQLDGEPALATEGDALLEEALALTKRAKSVVSRREQGYRYAPLDRSIAGGPKGGEDENWTSYDYRYLNRTHHVFYYREIDERVAAALRGRSAIELSNALLGPGESLVLSVLEASLREVEVDFGDGSVLELEEQSATHEYEATGIYDVAVTATAGGSPFSYEARVASLSAIVRMGYSGKIVAPAGAGIIEPVMPGLVYGPIDDERLAVGFSSSASGRVAPADWFPANIDEESPLTTEATAEVQIPVVIRSSETVVAHVVVRQLLLAEGEDEGEPYTALRGQMETDSIVRAAIAAGGGAFTEQLALNIVASTLGYTVATLPAEVPFEVRYTLPEAP